MIKNYGSGSSGNCTIIDLIDSGIMLDAGVNLKNIPSEVLRKIDGCLITHEHIDHVRYVKQVRSLSIDIYATEGTLNKIKRVNIDYRFHKIKAGKQFKFNDWKITPFESFHDAVEPVNYVIERVGNKIVYITDTYIAPWIIKGLTHIIVEANHDINILNESLEYGKVQKYLYNRIIENHLSISKTIDFLKLNDLSKVNKIYLAHLSKNNANPDKFIDIIQKLTGIETIILGG